MTSPVQQPARQRHLLLHAGGLGDQRRGVLGRARHQLALVPQLPTGSDHTSDPRPIHVTALGAFRVAIRGAVLPPAAWQSRKARDVLRILLSSRRRAVRTEVVTDALWPGESDRTKLANRLNVAVSTLRKVLARAGVDGGDIVRRQDDLLVLDLAHMTVDAVEFLAAATRGLAAHAEADPAAATLLERAERMYAGDFLVDSIYEDWSASMREELRSRYIEVAAALTVIAGEAADHDLRARMARRTLERDPYDESAHLNLVRALEASGRHGEARRRYDVYVEAMATLGIDAVGRGRLAGEQEPRGDRPAWSS